MPGTAQTLKAKLTEIRNSKYCPDDTQDYFSLATEMAEYLGSPDPELRDDLIYETFASWIEADRFSPTQLKHLLYTCLDDSHLFNKIGESGGDSVFTRTFSLLVIALIIGSHRRKDFLARADLASVKGKLVEYMRKEMDVRGYVDEKGWAHSTAHAADVFNELARCAEFTDPQDMMDILNALRGKAMINDYIYIHKEDERMVTAAVSVLNRRILEEQAVINWVESFLEIGKINKHPQDDYLRANVQSFLRSLYFRLLPDESKGHIRISLEVITGKLSKF